MSWYCPIHRPVVGVTNICLNRAFDVEITTLQGVVMHEIIHALVSSFKVADA